MKTILLTGLCTAFVVGLGGCESQAGPGYEGEPLLTVGGKVVIENPDAPGSLSPALAYVGEVDGSDAVYFSSVHVEGEFPASFRIDVYEPPPKEMLLPAHYRGAGKAAMAFITAVPPGLSGLQRFNAYSGSSMNCVSGQSDVDAGIGNVVETDGGPSVADGGATCTKDDVTCPSDIDLSFAESETACWHQRSTCESYSGPCTFQRSWGNQALSKAPWERFAGLSRNYLIVYLEDDVKAGTTFSQIYNHGRALGAGYHLLKIRVPDEAEITASFQCSNEVFEEVAPKYLRTLPDGGRVELDGETEKDLQDEVVSDMVERGCSLAIKGAVFDLVGPAAAKDITVQIAPNLEPVNPTENLPPQPPSTKAEASN